MNVRKYLSGALVVFLFFLLCTPNVASVKAASAAPGISAEAAALIDVASGRILYSKNGSKKMRIASLTKTMTAIVAIENGRLEDIVSVPKEAVGVEGSSIYLKNGEKLTLEELLYGLMLRSGNDAAVTVAHHIGGSVPGFVYLMNEKAAMIGMSHTNFTNPHGLDDSNMHYSTAEDMAKLSAYALKNPVFRQIVSTKVKNISWEGEEYDRRLQNKNKLLHLYQGADGVKTGYTKLAKRCLASSATRDGRQLATITLNAPDDWNDSMALMDWGFQQFSNVTVVEKGEIVETALSDRGQGIRLAALNEWIYPLRKEETAQIKKKVVLTEKQVSQAVAGSHAGFLQIFIGDRQIGQVPLAVLGDSPTMAKSGHHPTFWERVWKIIAGGMWSA
ncbi:D-alanyl-D-alanine carboxypeptidase family protein [Brevibacillus borstelensis]|uniref:D-alanyl-D-alanine carboxypeptidase family protein n=1 Tax=Brevibacillus borstelensis TaxID=45462 RepID=UPI00203A51B6|nr:D-alanyl-D-alanine carboxypeptidase family protein [Brevibacillus borstelensis]MCM3469719.1 D-alanyl-D-alanine carboxypeptidase [Brevibacillus borstelensis]MCM3620795.1 D-alanyl-D-alanine carboxypeptidase [Brevibacillus borstelensis]MED1851098.1 D-alanyl-D-alanine carboxypeptidase [Brevibacillus borstelensis]